MTGKLHGRTTIRANGQTFKTNKGSTLDPGGKVREPRPGDNDADGFVESINNATVDFNIQIREGVSLAAVQAMDDVTLTFACDTGQTYLINHAYCGAAPTIAGDGTIKAVFHGPPAEEML